MVAVTFIVIKTQTLDQAGNTKQSRFEISMKGKDVNEARKKARARCAELFPFCNVTLKVKGIV